MSFTLTMERFTGLIVNNENGSIRRIAPSPADDSIVSSQSQLDRTRSDLEAMIISETQKSVFPLEYMLALRDPYISQRNEILGNPFKYYNPFYKARLRQIDAKLDEIDVNISSLRTSSVSSEGDLKSIILASEARLAKCFNTLLDS
jgi:hypothetical protein